jgi:hypothetical protein
MIRMVVSIWFALTLLCPVFCLAETGGDCSAYAPQDGDNCEAMSIGAVVEKPGFGMASPDQSLPAFDGFLVPLPANKDRKSYAAVATSGISSIWHFAMTFATDFEVQLNG